MDRRNYKVYFNIGFSGRTTKIFETILENGSGPRFIRTYVAPQTVWKNIKPSNNGMRINDANNRSVHVYCTIDVVVNIEEIVETIIFNVLERIVTQVILWCYYCDKHVERICSDNEYFSLLRRKPYLLFESPHLESKMRSHNLRNRRMNRLDIVLSTKSRLIRQQYFKKSTK